MENINQACYLVWLIGVVSRFYLALDFILEKELNRRIRESCFTPGPLSSLLTLTEMYFSLTILQVTYRWKNNTLRDTKVNNNQIIIKSFYYQTHFMTSLESNFTLGILWYSLSSFEIET